MQRWKITVEYDGSPYVGWQIQNNHPTIQGALQKALYRFSGEHCLIQGSGRTDSGVHALGQVAHFDLEKPATGLKIREAMNSLLREETIAILDAEAVPATFNARFDARERSYLYRILDRRAKPALDRGRVWHVGKKLDADAMQQAAQILVGRHDFSSFRAAECQAKSPVKTLDMLQVTRAGDEIHINAIARSFLHHQIRNFAGTLKMVGAGKWNANRVKAALEARNRQAAGPTAPPDGLYLTWIKY